MTTDARLLLLPALLALVTLPACEEDPAVPETELGEDDDNDPNAPEDDPAAPALPPANWTALSTTSAPSLLSVYANGSETNAGTGATLRLTYINQAGTYSCTVAGVGAGKTASCTPTKSSGTISVVDDFRLAFATSSNTDGLRFSTVTAKIGGTSYALENFNVMTTIGWDGDLTCTGCTLAFDCGSCYLDADNHTGCIDVTIPMNKIDTMTCNDFGDD